VSGVDIAFLVTKTSGGTSCAIEDLTYNVPQTVSVPTLTGNLDNPAYRTGESSTDSALSAWHMFDTVINASNSWTCSTFVYDTTSGVYTGVDGLGSEAGEWSKLSFDYPTIVTSHRVRASGGITNPLAYKILVSDDNANWTEAYTTTSFSGTDTGVTGLTGGPYICKYIAMIVIQIPTSNTNGNVSVFEMNYS